MTNAHPAGSRGARRRARYREIAKVLWEERIFNLLQGSGLEEHAPESVGSDGAEAVPEKSLPRAVRIRRALERLGPAFIKAGQILATRRDLVTPDLAAELAKLQDDVPTMPWDEMRPRIEQELGGPIAELFSEFDTTPLAAASIGQVYKAGLPDGTPVAVKVQRPGVSETMEIDLEILVDLGRKVSAHTQWGKDFDVSALTQEFADVLRSELDYTHEGRSMDTFREDFAADETVVFPEVFWDHTTSRVLTMSFIDGVPGTKLETEDVPGIDRAQLVQAGVGVYFRMIFDLGFYHADPHAGNLFALTDGRIAFVDFGRTSTVSRRNRDAVFDMLLAVFDDDPRAATEAVLAMTGMPPEVDVARLEVELARLVALYRRSEASGGGLEDLMQRLLTLVREHHLHLPTELTVLLTTLGMLDGVAAQLDSSFRMVDAAKPFARHMVPQEFGPERLFKATMRSARAYARFFDDLPVQATRVLRRAGEGEFRISVRPTEYADLMQRVQTGFTLLAYALIVSALIIGGAFLVGRVGLSPVEKFGARAVLVAALVSVVWLLVGLVRAEYRKWRQARREAA
jgi:ubiquinone biosynthesis protein